MGNECSTTTTPWKSNKICLEDPSKYVLTYSILNNPKNISIDDVEQIIAKVFSIWAFHTNYVYQKSLPNESAEIYISFNDDDEEEEKNQDDKDDENDVKVEEEEGYKLLRFPKTFAFDFSYDTRVGKSTLVGKPFTFDDDDNNDNEVIKNVVEVVDSRVDENTKKFDEEVKIEDVDKTKDINVNGTTDEVVDETEKNQIDDSENGIPFQQTVKINFKGKIPWTKNFVGEKVDEDTIDLLYMALYAIGEMQNLQEFDYNDKTSIMYPFYVFPIDSEGNYVEPKLSDEDIAAVKGMFLPEKNNFESNIEFNPELIAFHQINIDDELNSSPHIQEFNDD